MLRILVRIKSVVDLTNFHYDALHPATLKRFVLFIRSLANARFLTHRANIPSECRGFTASHIKTRRGVKILRDYLKSDKAVTEAIKEILVWFHVHERQCEDIPGKAINILMKSISENELPRVNGGMNRIDECL